jgi:eukaryotic-like serine/threonine-protein kinase
MLSKNAVSATVLRLGNEFELDLGAFELRKRGEPQRLGRIPMELLLLLVEQRGQLVTRDRIIERVWGKDVFLDTDNSINAAIRKIRQVLDDDPEQPRYVHTLIGRGYRFIAEVEEVRCPELRPAADAGPSTLPAATSTLSQEPKSSAQLAPLAALPVGGSLLGASRKPVYHRFVLLGAAAVLLLVLAGTVGGVRDRLFHRAPVDNPKSARIRPSVAVLGFKNLSGREDQAWLSTALSEMFDAELASGQKLRLIAAENVARMKLDLSLPSSDTYAADTLMKIRRNLGSDMVVLGSYLALGPDAAGKVHVNVQVQDARSGEIIAALSEDGTESSLPELVSRSGGRVRDILRIGTVSSVDAVQVRATFPQNPEAARLYAEGLAKLRAFDVLAARELFSQAVGADPGHALSHAALAECWWSLGLDEKAREEGQKALTLSANLSREDQLSVEARYRWSAHEWPRAVEIYRTLWEVFPDNLDYGVNLARVEAAAGMGREAIATVDALAKNPLALDDPRIDLAEASAADKLGDLHREERAAARAADKGLAQGTRILAGRALLTRGSALIALGENTNAVATLTEAQTIFRAVGDRQGVARVLNNLAVIARHESRLDDAQKNLEQALKIFQQTGSKQGALQALNNLGNVFWERGDIRHALQYHQQSLALSREMNDQRHESTSLGNIAGLLQLQGKLSEARQAYEQSLQLARDMGDREGMGTTLGNLADLLTRQGDLVSARKLAEEALRADQESGVKTLEGYALYQLAAVLAAEGETQAAQARYEESARVRQQIHEAETQAESELALAHLELERGEFAAAERTARAVIEVFRKAKSTDNETLGNSLLAMALVRRQNVVDAKRVLRRCEDLLPKTVDFAVRLEAELEIALVTGISSSAPDGKFPAQDLQRAMRSLESVEERALRSGHGGLALEARLSLAELKLRAGRTAGVRAALLQLEKEARDRGFVAIANRAAALGS